MKSLNAFYHHPTVTRRRRESLNQHKAIVIWFTGLSGAGKSTLAHALEEKLHQLSCRTFVLDGDNTRHGLCGDLAFSDADRKENLRRIGHLSKLFIEAGVILITAFISPFRQDRRRVRELIAVGDFLEIYVKCPISICEDRDTKGLYRQAKKGEIKNFTGISSKYEVPNQADFMVDTSVDKVEESVDKILNFLLEKQIVSK